MDDVESRQVQVKGWHRGETAMASPQISFFGGPTGKFQAAWKQTRAAQEKKKKKHPYLFSMVKRSAWALLTCDL